MKFGTFYEHQLPKPWAEDSEHKLYQEALEQIKLADELGYDYVWEVEHHFLEEYSHSSAPGIFLAAAARETEQIRLGHGVRLIPPQYNHPARIAEMAGTLDLVSDGRLELGTGESNTRIELEGFGVSPDEKYEAWRELTRQVADMMSMEPYPGYDGEHLSMPPRNVIPKPVQKPHPPMWMACSSPETLKIAARNGLGALTFIFQQPEEAEEWVNTYYETFKEECVPISHSVNPNVAMVSGFSCHDDEEEAYRRGAQGFAFFQYALGHIAIDGRHVPGHTNLWERFLEEGGINPYEKEVIQSSIGTPAQIRDHLKGYAEAGVDQIIFLQQSGNMDHEHICESLEIFAEEVMPEFHENQEERDRRKKEELEPYIEAAMERKQSRDPVDPEDLSEIVAYDRDRFPERVSQPPSNVDD